MNIRNFRLILIILLTILLLASASIANKPSSEYFKTAIILRTAALLMLSYLIIFYKDHSSARYSFFTRLVSVAVPVSVLASILIMWVRPGLAAYLGTEDRGLEILQPILLFCSSLIFIFIAINFFVQKKKVSLTIAILASILLFVMGMEEISWMQRIVGIESSDFFIEHNMQEETNIHNFASRFFNVAYLMAGFILLTLATYYRDLLIKLSSKLKGIDIRPFIPSGWIFLPFSATVGFLNTTHSGSAWLLFIIAFTFTLLARESVKYFHTGDRFMGVWCLLLMSLIVASYITGLSGPVAEITPKHAVFEFRETFIVLGILIYSIDVYIRNFTNAIAKLETRAQVQ